MSKIGRNDPCPCGSGKKYKKCCMNKDMAQNHYNVAKQNLITKLLNFLYQDRFRMQGKMLYEDYYDFMRIDYEKELSQQENIEFSNIAIFDTPMEEDKRLVEIFYEEEAENLIPKEREILENWLDMVLGVYEVQEVKQGKGFLLENLLINETVFVTESKMFAGVINRWDIIIGRICKIGSEHQIVGSFLKLPNAIKNDLMNFINVFLVEYREENKKATIKEFLRDYSMDILSIPKQIQRLQEQMPRILVNRDGDKIEMCRAYFSIKSRSFIKNRLNSHPDINYDDSKENKDYFVWVSENTEIKKPIEENTILATITLENESLVLEANSRKRLEKGKKLIKDLLGIAAIHREDTVEDIKEYIERNKDLSADKEPEPIPPELKEIERTMLIKYYREWVDKPVPILGGRTPREASKTPEGKKQLREMLKEFEQTTKSMAEKKGYDPVDFNEIRKMLNLDKPEPEPLTQLQDRVEELFIEKTEGFYTRQQIENGLQLWRDFKKEYKSIRGKTEGWAAAVEYTINRLDFINLTQKEIGEKYGVSSSTVAAKYKLITDKLNVSVFDSHYGTVKAPFLF